MLSTGWQLLRDPCANLPLRIALPLFRFPMSLEKVLASVEHVAQSRLLAGGDGQLVVALDSDPGLGVGAVEALQGGLPAFGAAVALGAVGLLAHGVELRALDVVGKVLALGLGPARGTRLCR